jgi:hypothetical protein
MPFMQRLTWGGVALHGGKLPGYPASHGCVRLPPEFARLLYGVTRLGMTVVITNEPAVPRVAPTPAFFASPESVAVSSETGWWPDRAPAGPVSIVVSTSDLRVVVLRNGVIIGQAALTIDSPINESSAYVLQSSIGSTRRWLRIPLPGPLAGATNDLRGQLHVREDFQHSVESILQPGATVVITPDSLSMQSPWQVLTVVDDRKVIH